MRTLIEGRKFVIYIWDFFLPLRSDWSHVFSEIARMGWLYFLIFPPYIATRLSLPDQVYWMNKSRSVSNLGVGLLVVLACAVFWWGVYMYL